MEDLVEIGREFVRAMRDRRGIEHVDAIYTEHAESIEAVVPPGRDRRIAKGRPAIKAKRIDWIAKFEMHRLEADGPYVHPPNKFGVRFEAEVTQRATGQRMILRELAIYSLQADRIVREEFFMLPR